MDKKYIINCNEDIVHDKMINTLINTKEQMKQLRKENKKLKEENEKLNEEFAELIKELDSQQELLNEESQQRLKNKECWMSVKDQYWEVRKENEKLKEQLNTIFPSKTEQAVISKYQVQRTNNLRTIEKLKEQLEESKKK